MAEQATQRSRLFWILGALVILLLVVIWFVSNLVRIQDQAAPSDVDVRIKSGQKEDMVSLNADNTSDLYIQGIQAQNQQRAQQAQTMGASHVDRLVNGIVLDNPLQSPEFELLKKQITDLQEEQRELTERLRDMTQKRQRKRARQVDAVGRYVGMDGVEYLSKDYQQQEQEVVLAVFDQMAQSSAAPVIGIVQGLQIDPNATGSRNQSNGRAANTLGSVLPPATPDIQIIPASGEIMFARLNLGLNTDVGGIASATIVGGEFHGTVLTASTFAPKRRHLAINFDRFCLPSGICGNIDAIAVDLDQGVGAVKGKYKGYYGLRFGGGVVASIIEGYGRATSAGIGSTSIFVDGRLISQAPREVSSEEALRASAQEAGSTIGGFFRELASRPPTISKEINEMIGVYIYSPGVLSSGNNVGERNVGRGSLNQASISEGPQQAALQEMLQRVDAQSQNASGGA